MKNTFAFVLATRLNEQLTIKQFKSYHQCLKSLLYIHRQACMNACTNAYMTYIHTCIQSYIHTVMHAYSHTYIHTVMRAFIKDFLHPTKTVVYYFMYVWTLNDKTCSRTLPSTGNEQHCLKNASIGMAAITACLYTNKCSSRGTFTSVFCTTIDNSDKNFGTVFVIWQ